MVCQISFLAADAPAVSLDADAPANCLDDEIFADFLEADAPAEILLPMSCLICQTSCFGVRFNVGGLVGVVDVAAPLLIIKILVYEFINK